MLTAPRSQPRLVVFGAAAAAVALAATAAVACDPPGAPPIPYCSAGVVAPEQCTPLPVRTVAIGDLSRSTQGPEWRAFVEDMTSTVLPAAFEAGGDLAVVAVSDRSATRTAPIARVPAQAHGDSDELAAEVERAMRTQLARELDDAFATRGAPPRGSDVVGALATAVGLLDTTGPTGGIYLGGDAVPTTADGRGCHIDAEAAEPLGSEDMAALLEECQRVPLPAMDGITVHLLGAGTDLEGPLTAAAASDATALLTALITAAGGVVERP